MILCVRMLTGVSIRQGRMEEIVCLLCSGRGDGLRGYLFIIQHTHRKQNQTSFRILFIFLFNSACLFRHDFLYAGGH